jgi:hypothetical protein
VREAGPGGLAAAAAAAGAAAAAAGVAPCADSSVEDRLMHAAALTAAAAPFKHPEAASGRTDHMYLMPSCRMRDHPSHLSLLLLLFMGLPHASCRTPSCFSLPSRWHLASAGCSLLLVMLQ